MSQRTYRVTWGDFLYLQAAKHGGLKSAVLRIRAEIGPQIGTRNAFSPLFEYESPAELRETDRWRAWLLLVAFGQDPNEWGIDDDCVPGSVSIPKLRQHLKPPKSACSTEAEEVAA
jgi:hypothetical protein